MFSFLKNQEIRAVAGLLKKSFIKKGLEPPSEQELLRQAKSIVEKSNSTASQTGKNLKSIFGDMVNDIKGNKD